MICGACGRIFYPDTDEAGLEHNRQFHPTAIGGLNTTTGHAVIGGGKIEDCDFCKMYLKTYSDGAVVEPNADWLYREHLKHVHGLTP